MTNLLPFRTCVEKCVEQLQWTFKLGQTHERTRPSVGTAGNLSDCVRHHNLSERQTAHVQQAGKENSELLIISQHTALLQSSLV